MIAAFLDVRPWLHVFLHAKGYYLLPVWSAVLVAAYYALSRRTAVARVAEARVRAAQRGLLATLVISTGFAALVYVGFFNFIYGGFLNPYEFFHYYLGSKYAPEIGYFDLYNAAVVADLEDGPLIRADTGLVSNLQTYNYLPLKAVLAEGDRVKAKFSDARWREWVRDVSYFKHRLGPKLFNDLIRDKGYNATPVWSMLVGRMLSGRVPTTSEAGMTALALLDVVLLLCAVGCIGWAFGVWPALLTVMFIASSYLMAHVHMKGAFLRTDFVVALVAAMCLIARGRHGFAGALVGYATLARVFPAIFLFGPAVLLLRDLRPAAGEELRRLREGRGAGAAGWTPVVSWVVIHAAVTAIALQAGWLLIGEGLRSVATDRLGSWGLLFSAAIVPATAVALAVSLTVRATVSLRVDARHARFLGGFSLAVLLLLGASVVHAGGTRDWEGFARKIALHRETYNHWNIGMTSLVVGRFDDSGPRRAALAQRPRGTETWRGNLYFTPQDVREKAGTILVLQILALAVSCFAAARLKDARAFAFGFVPTFFLTAPTYYYYIVLLLPFLYFASDLDRLRGTLGTIYLFLFGALGFAFYFRWDQYFATYYWNSALALGLTLAMAAAAFAEAPGAPTCGAS